MYLINLCFFQPYKLTCTLSSTYDLTTTGADSRSCTVTAVAPSTFTGSPLTMTVPDGQTSVTSGPIFTSGTQVSVDGFLTVTATNIGWDADAQTVTMNSDQSTTLTLTETGPRMYTITCNIALTGVDLTDSASNNNGGTCFIINLSAGGFQPLVIPANSNTIVSGEVFSAATYQASISATIGGAMYADTAQTKVMTTSNLIYNFNLSPVAG